MASPHLSLYAPQTEPPMHTVPDLMTRVEILERRVRRLHLGVAIGLICVTAAALTGAMRGPTRLDTDELRANRFVLVQPDGVVRGILGVENNVARLILHNGDERKGPCLLTGVSKNGGFLHLVVRNQKDAEASLEESTNQPGIILGV